jgi:hypothetical protein
LILKDCQNPHTHKTYQNCCALRRGEDAAAAAAAAAAEDTRERERERERRGSAGESVRARGERKGSGSAGGSTRPVLPSIPGKYVFFVVF